MKDLFLITTYAPDNLRRDMLRNFVNSINKDLFDIMVVSHSSIPEDIIDNINYFIYDADNSLLTDVEYKYQMYFNTEHFKVLSTENRPFNHTLAALKLVTLGLSTARTEGYEKVHCIEYDTDLKSDKEFIENSQLLDDYSLVYYQTDYVPDLISFPVSFNVNKINNQWFEFDKDYLKKWVENDPFKTIENYERLLISKENFYSKFYTNLKDNGVIINLYFSGGEDVWITPIVNNDNKLFIFSWNKSNTLKVKDIELYNIKIIVNNKSYHGWDLRLNAWGLRDLGEFNDIDTLTVIRNNIKIVDYDFNKINRDKYKSLNYIEYL
tara:strand:- start:962 stop:1930 length:969 start_codon:yes stop_codon:yes gene_type:complete